MNYNQSKDCKAPSPRRHLARISTLGKAGSDVENHRMLLRDEPNALVERHLRKVSERIPLVNFSNV